MAYSIKHFNLHGTAVSIISVDGVVLSVSNLDSIERSSIVINDIEFYIFQTTVINYATD